VQYRCALLEVELACGAILKNRDMDITQAELKRQTASLMEESTRRPSGMPF
jgi:hypothetical protein